MDNDAQEAPAPAAPWKKFAVLAAVAAVAAFGVWQFGDKLSLDYLATQESTLKQYQQDHPVLTYGLAFLVYAAATGLSLPGAALVLTLSYGWFFGMAAGLILVSFASTAGATMAFLISRFLFRDSIQSRFGDRLDKFNQALEREGPFYLFTLRLIPAVPFFVINVVMGLTPIRTLTFWWVSQLGMLAGTAVFVYAGSSVPTLAELAENGAGGILTPKIFAAFVVLGLFPLAARWLMARFKPGSTDTPVANGAA
ncbi:MAG: TVP38/TMEM64 family protein [Planctomycetota bacterium]